MQKVLITKASYRDCRRAVEEALAAFPLAVRGRKVLVKVNAMTSTEPEEGVVTHPAILQALLDRLEEMGTGEVAVGDNPGIAYYGKNQSAFLGSTLGTVAGDRYLNLGKEARVLPFNPTFIDRVFVSRAVLDADVVISVPKFKTHARVGISVALKNNFGTLPGAQKANLHHRAPAPLDFARMLVDVYRLRPPDLIIVDGILGMEGIGPYSNELRYLGLLLASDNGVALDATVARMMGYDPDQVPLLRFAQEAGLGSYLEQDIETLGGWEPIPNFRRPEVGDLESTIPITYQGSMRETPTFRPRVDPSKCDGCRICAEVCPPGALVMANGLPHLEASLCVPCYCCQENCPREAISMGRPAES